MKALDSQSSAQLQAYRANAGAFAASRLAQQLAGMSNKEFLLFMKKEVASGLVSSPRPQPLTKPPQTMLIYEYPDGTVVRYKLRGDKYRHTPTYSVEVRPDATKPDLGPGSEAFKLGSDGRPQPKNEDDVSCPYPKSTNKTQHEAFVEQVMELAHHGLSK